MLLAQDAARQHIGIIGGGIGGAAAAYYVRNFVGDQVSVTIFEQNDYLGGRLKHLDIDGATVNLGGDAWSSVRTDVFLCAIFINATN